MIYPETTPAIAQEVIKANSVPMPYCGCWIWMNATHPRRYSYGRTSRYMFGTKFAHRVSFIAFKGQLPPDRPLVCHKCDTPECVNPEHLFAGSASDNMQDSVSKGRFKKTGYVSGANHLRPTAKITPETAIKISQAIGSTPLAEIARQFGVGIGTITRIKWGDLWSHYTGRPKLRKEKTASYVNRYNAKRRAAMRSTETKR